ncbi:unnamed protein product, partial [Allacma fusca]
MSSYFLCKHRKVKIFTNTRTQDVTFFKRFFNVPHALGYIPYKYDVASRELQFLDTLSAKLLFKAHVFLVVIYEVVLITHYVQTIRRKSSTIEQKITGFFFPTAIAALGINHVISYNNWGTLHVLFNQSTVVFEDIKEASKGLENYRLFKSDAEVRMKKLFKLFTNLAIFALIISCVLRAGKVMIKPRSGELISSVLRYIRPGKEVPMWMRFPFAILQFNVTCFHGYGLCLHAIISVVNGINVSGALSALRIPSKNAEEYYYTLTLQMFSRSYYRIQVLQCVFNQVYSSWPLLFDLCTIVIVTVRLFLAIVNQ